MENKKVELDTSFIWALKGLKQVGSEDGVDYYHEDGMEYCVMEHTRWSAADTTESTTNGER